MRTILLSSINVILMAVILFFMTSNSATQPPLEKSVTFQTQRDTSMKKIIQTPQAPSPIGPYSQGVEYGNMVFISGQVAKDPETGNLITTDIKSETKQVMENLKAILAAGGVEFSHVVKTTVFLTDMKNFPDMNEVYGSYFTGEFPARETVSVVGLPLGVNVEISMIAVK